MWSFVCVLNSTLIYCQDSFGDLALFFCDPYGGTVIAVLWNPKAFIPLPFKVSHSHPLSESINLIIIAWFVTSWICCFYISSTLTWCFFFMSHHRRHRCPLGAWRWPERKRKLSPMSKQYWRTSGTWERAWSNRWKPGLKNGHFSQILWADIFHFYLTHSPEREVQ